MKLNVVNPSIADPIVNEMIAAKRNFAFNLTFGSSTFKVCRANIIPVTKKIPKTESI